MTASVHREELILHVAQRLSGAITMPVVEALYPDVHRSVLVRLLARMCRLGGPLVKLRQLGGQSGVWLTTQPADSRHPAGIKRWLDANAREAMRVRNRHPERWSMVRPALPVTFTHDQIAGTLVAGYGHEHGMVFDSELTRSKLNKTPDGRAWISPDSVIEIEVERMVRQPVSRWSRAGGLIATMVSEMHGVDSNRHHLVVAPRRHLHSLVRGVEERANALGYIEEWQNDERQCGYWTLALEDVLGPPTWNVVGVASHLVPLIGLRDRHEASPIRQCARQRDNVAKAQAEARRDREAEAVWEAGMARGRALLRDDGQQRKRYRERQRRARRRAERQAARPDGGTHEVGGAAPGVPRSGAG